MRFQILLLSLCTSLSVSAKYHEPDLSVQLSQNNDEWVGTVTANLQATEEISFTADIDSTGYLEIGSGYGVMFGQFYTEAFVSYGRADLIDIYNVGVFTGTALTKDIMLFANTSHEWRDNVFSDALNLKTNREWKNTLGASYTINQWSNFSYSFTHDRELTGSKSYYNSQDITLTLKPKWVEPYVKYTFGESRVSPSDRTRTENSYEIGFNLRF
ncbi:hypothetical protein GNP79_15315 [Aliivibrio fischeri]|uniref:Porin n=1 Tax=Aliivibrio fischeri TaxID=668 RepID=A0A6I3YNE8_ALIFS|nr:hypothetical protein [Aliivibrio fischeri]MUJ18620.1 hypothetical protein [Aliivibrio fischeri]MUJ25937.1 hypothetical protein [Aliivibrio fischeri]MUK45436.1 hypothetical protein [Aliivibrio fischeri]MUK82164.1 hypothetical protein [Aliivibrio fischeri]MUK86124.1 hypothetical protein [Aliivibrio fischeri]